MLGKAEEIARSMGWKDAPHSWEIKLFNAALEWAAKQCEESQDWQSAYARILAGRSL